MKYLPTEGMKEALLRNAIQIWLRLEEKLSAQLTDEADLPSEGWKNEIPLRGMKYLPTEGMKEASQRRCNPDMASPRGEAVSDS